MARRARSKATPARILALEITREMRQREAYVRELIDARREASALEAEEFAYAQVLSFGVAMCQGVLDELIDRNLNSPKDIKPKVRDALRISAYELLFLGKPAHAVVDQGVELVRFAASRAAGLANAVLRKMAEDAKAFPWGDTSKDDVAFARRYGVPTWLSQLLIEECGRVHAAEILEACLSPAPTYLRENPFSPHDAFASDLSAQLVASLVPLEAPMLEIGAGRGTKTMLIESHALESLGHAIPIHAVDLHEYRANLLSERMGEYGIKRVRAYAGDARNLDAIAGLPQEFASVLVDVPCSGTGTLRRHPEIRWRLKPDVVDELAKLQAELLEAAATRVEPGGTLIYATCSILGKENRAVVDEFLTGDVGSRFCICPITVLAVPEGAVLASSGMRPEIPANWGTDERGCFVSHPALDAPDGHFAAVFRRLR